MKNDDDNKMEKPPQGQVSKPDPGALQATPSRSFPFFPFLTFRYSFRSMHTDGEQAHLKAREARYENGRLETEEFEGSAPLPDYFRAVAEMQKALMQPIERLLKPFLPKRDPGDDA